VRFGHFFIDRPRFAAVISILIVMVGGLAYFQLPITQYPEISPPTVQVNLIYPGATAETVAETIAGPIEQAINGVEGMLYLNSSATADGALSISVVFELGTDLDTAQILVQNRIASVEPRLPEEVRRLGIAVSKSSSDFLMVVHLLSPDEVFDELYISNYALLRVADPLRRIRGVGQLIVFGAREYGMRIWLDPERLAAHGLTAGEMVAALRAQNVQVSAGTLGQPPMPLDNAFQFTVGAQGRFETVEEFEQVIVKSGEDGRLTRLVDVARVELGAQDYVRNSYLNGQQAAGIGVFQRPGSNALATAKELRETIAELSNEFPKGLEYRIAYDPTVFVEESVTALNHTIFEAIALVVLVIILFLQSWRAAVIPIVAIPVSLIGTFAVMQVFGFSLNSLSLFGLVLAIGIVVDDAIVVVEDMERNLSRGLAPWAAARQTMTEVGAALVSMALVLVAVFVPTIFLGGISGQFFRQFGVTVAVATVISAFNSLTLSPALGALLLHSREEAEEGWFGRLWNLVLGGFFGAFNRGFERFNQSYGRTTRRMLGRPVLAVLIFLVLLAVGALLFTVAPAGFIPHQDQGFLIVAASLPPASSLQRTDAVVLEADALLRAQEGISDVVGIVGFSGATFATASNAAAMFVLLDPIEERGEALSSSNMARHLQGVLSQIREAQFFVIDPPPVRGLGVGGGFKMMVQDRAGGDLPALEAATWQLAGAANQDPRIGQAFTTFNNAQPRYWVDIDRVKAQEMGIPLSTIFETLQIQLGAAYVNDFNRFGRTYQVTAQADALFRLDPEDLERLYVRNRDGEMVPLGSLATVRQSTGTDRVVRYNLYTAAELQGAAAPGVSSAQAIAAMEELAAKHLPSGYGFEWTEIALQEKLAGNSGLWIFPLSVLFVLLLLTAQYESWSLPIAVILIVPLCVVFALFGVWIAGFENNILTQIGFVVLIGLACKNAILVVEFARQKEEQGMGIVEAAAEAARLRLRPILMTALAFILGVVPLVLATGSGFEMRRNLGTAVFSGMIGVTLSGLFLTPVFYVIVRRFVGGDGGRDPDRGGLADRETDPAIDPALLRSSQGVQS
jgi:HAE1 family hydrophobic/amphiphilic exporter-1